MRMSEAEKRALYDIQKQVVIHYRDQSQRQIDMLRARINDAMRRAQNLGISFESSSEQITRCNSENDLLGEESCSESAAPRETGIDVPIIKKQRIMKPLVGRRRMRAAENRCSYDFTYVNRRLRQIDREIDYITRRFKKFKIGEFYCKQRP